MYVIGNPNDVLVTQAGTRAIAPRSSILEGTSQVPTSIKKVLYFELYLGFCHSNDYLEV